MAKTKAERRKEMEEALSALEAEPDDEPASRRGENLNFTIDLSDEAAVERAIKLGLLTREDTEEDEEEETPTIEPAPTRRSAAARLIGADE